MKFQPVAAFVALLLCVLPAGAQTTIFTYQGKLSDSGNAASGNYDFRFRLFDISNNIVAGPITNTAVVVTNGMFTTPLNFGSAVFDGDDRWLELAVRSNGTAVAFVALSPLQQLTSVPYAIQSITASNAATLTIALPGTNISGTIPDARLSSNVPLLSSNETFIGTVTANNPANNFFGTFGGNGNGLTNLAATNLTGTILDARLSSNVPLLNTNQIFSSSNTFNGVVTATNAANVFSGAFTGNGVNLTNIPATILTGTLPDVRLSSNVALLNNTNNPNLIFAASITATNFIGAGHGLTNVPGAFFWVTVSNTSAQSFPNVGYICTNNLTPVTITLPASPSVGDTFKIAGVGDAGWIIAQNAGQYISAGNLSSSVGQSWTATATNQGALNWSAIASSADGTKLAATVYNGNIFTSTNSGATWTSQASSLGNLDWSAIASSADGTRLVAAVGYSPYNASATGSIYTNSGTTWKVVSGTAGLAWSCVASSADGSKLVAAIRDGSIYTSSNFGATWTAVSGTSGGEWDSVASSSDGSKIIGVDGSGYIYTSTYGVTNINSLNFTAAASSADGKRLVATTEGGAIYISTDAGATWNQDNSGIGGQLTGVASSADGSRLATSVGIVLSSSSGNIYGSSDSGATWTQLVGSPVLSWSGIASSADGSLLAATVRVGYIYISSQSSTTTGTGYLSGAQHSAIELIYVGNGNFLPLNHEGTIRAY